MENLKNLGMALTHQNCIYEKIMQIKSGLCLLPSLNDPLKHTEVYENRVVGRIYGTKWKEVTVGYRPHNEEHSMDCMENTVSNSSSTVAYVSVVMGTRLLGHCLVMTISSHSTIQAFRWHITIP
jgi:hypothetical protein